MPGTLEFCKGIAVVAFVLLLPWIAGWFDGASLFGFPGSAFILLLAGPLCLIALAGGGAQGSGAEHDRPDT